MFSNFRSSIKQKFFRSKKRTAATICISIMIIAILVCVFFLWQVVHNSRKVFHGTNGNALSASAIYDKDVREKADQMYEDLKYATPGLIEAAEKGDAATTADTLRVLNQRMGNLAGSIEVADSSQDKAKVEQAILVTKQENLDETIKELKANDAALRQDMFNLVIGITCALIGGLIALLIEYVRRHPQTVARSKKK